MPKKPNPQVIAAANAVLDPKAVLTTVIQETPELRDALLAEGLIEQVGEPYNEEEFSIY